MLHDVGHALSPSGSCSTASMSRVKGNVTTPELGDAILFLFVNSEGKHSSPRALTTFLFERGLELRPCLLQLVLQVCGVGWGGGHPA